MIPFDTLFSLPYKANFTSLVQIPDRTPDIVIEGLKMWSTPTGLTASISDFTKKVGKLSLFYFNSQPVHKCPVCVYATWENVTPIAPQIRVYERFYVCGNKSKLSIRTVCERLTEKLKIADGIKRELYRQHKPEKLLFNELSRVMWAKSEGECWYDDGIYIYILVLFSSKYGSKHIDRYIYKPFMRSDECHSLILKAFTVADFEVIKTFIDIAKAVRLIDLRR